jgi:MFS transporter, UMF1 family
MAPRLGLDAWGKWMPGLHRPELRAWAMYDWANSVFMTTIVAVFPIYLAEVAAAGVPGAVTSERYALATTFSMVLIAVMAPVLGALADQAGVKKKMLAGFLALGVLSTGALFWVERGDWKLGLVLFMLSNLGVTGSLVFYESLLPHIASEDELDRVSTAGFAAGYLGGGLILALNFLWIAKPAVFGLDGAAGAMRFSFLAAAFWWAGFSIPLFRTVREPPADPRRAGEGNLLVAAFTRLGHTLSELRTRSRDAFLFLAAFMLYNDGISTIIRMAPVYGAEIGIDRGALIGAYLLVQFVGVPFAFLFGALAGRIGAKRAIFLSLVVYTVIAFVAYRMQTAREFFLLATLVGTVQGGSQALSRSVFARLIPRHKSSELFAFFGVFEKFAGIFGPLLFAVMIHATGSSRGAALSLVGFFAVGGLMLAFVDIERGQTAARESEARAAAAFPA